MPSLSPRLNHIQGQPSTLNQQEGCDLTDSCLDLQTAIDSATCIDLRATSHRICANPLYRPRIRKHPPCSSASTRNVPSSRTSNNYANSVLVLLVRWSNSRKNCPLFQMAPRVRLLLLLYPELKLILSAIATVLSNWHTVLRAIHMASCMP